MKKKPLKMILPAILMGLMVVFSACQESEDIADKGRETAVEFCACYKKNTAEECLEELKSRYSSYEYKTDDFIEAFNETSTCNIELILEYEEAAATFGTKNKPEISFFNIKP